MILELEKTWIHVKIWIPPIRLWRKMLTVKFFVFSEESPHLRTGIFMGLSGADLDHYLAWMQDKRMKFHYKDLKDA